MNLPVKIIVRVLNEYQWNIVIDTLIDYYNNDLNKYHHSQKGIKNVSYNINDKLLGCVCSDQDGFIGSSDLEWFENKIKYNQATNYGDIIYLYEEFIELFKYKFFDINNLMNDFDKLESKFK